VALDGGTLYAAAAKILDLTGSGSAESGDAPPMLANDRDGVGDLGAVFVAEVDRR
jgi:hypothetical protein